MASKTKRRGRGEGSIFQRSDGSWSAEITVGYAVDANGKPKRLRRTIYGETKREVQAKLGKLQSAKLDGTLCDAERLTVAAFLDRWLTDVARATIRQTSYALYEGLVSNHINKRLGGVALAKLTPAHVQGLYSAMEQGGASARLRQQTHNVLRRALKQAVKWGMIPRNVCDAVDPPRVPRPTVTALTPDQTATLLDAAKGDRLEALFVVAVTSGLRQGELFALQWPDVDLDAGTVTVRHTLLELKKERGGFVLGEPKSAKGRRRVELPAMAVDALAEHRKRMLAEGHAASSWVFSDTGGSHLRKSNFVRRVFKPLLKSAGLPDIRFHDLRHTSATLMLAEGVHPKIVQERLGHATIGLTLDTYSHVMPGMGRDAATKMDGILKRAEAGRKRAEDAAKAVGA
ncbi:MAG: tyrosine recombinase XerC [Pirellulales bacterium]